MRTTMTDFVKATRLAALLRESADAMDTPEISLARVHAPPRMREAATRLELLAELIEDRQDDGAVPIGALVHVLDRGETPEPFVKPSTTLQELQTILDANQLSIDIGDYADAACFKASIIEGEDGGGNVLGEGFGTSIWTAINSAVEAWKRESDDD